MPVQDSAAKRLFWEDPLALLELADRIVSVKNLDDFLDLALPALARSMSATGALLYLEDPRLFLYTGLPAATVPTTEKICAEQYRRLSTSNPPSAPLFPASGAPGLALFPLKTSGKLALLGLTDPGPEVTGARLAEKMLPLCSHALDNLLDRLECEKRNRHLNTYLTVSSMIAQALDLRDVLEAVLYFCMDALSAEAASVLLLDYSKENFRFYSAEGPTKPVLLTATFPANQGLAGAVLETQQAEIINDVQHDPRFYGKFDAESGFHTRNMIVIPLTAGEEKIGVLEVLNKTEGKPFTEEELLLLQSIAEEVAFAIRNGKLFEVVVKSYCKQRQGLNTCKGCKRPLGSWTPCVKYREESGVMD